MTATVMLLGSGGREHALAWKLRQSPGLGRLVALPGSDAIGELAERVAGDPADGAAVVAACRERGVDLVVVGPEAPLAAGVCDALRAEGIRAFGPGRAAARLESSKAFAKDFMRRHRIPTAEAEVFEDPGRAQDAAAELPLPLVVKADGLAAGKGVRVCRTRREALQAVRDFMLLKTLGLGGSRILLERCLEGPEATVMAFCDGKTALALPVSRDHKRLCDGDRGPNTGGMGAFAPVELEAGARAAIRRDILDRILGGLTADGLDFRGLLYCGLMLTREGPKVLEFNVRFGDPETQAVLPLLRSDLLDLAEATAEGRLSGRRVETRPGHAVAVVLASEGYPETPKTGRTIEGLGADPGPDTTLFHAGTARREARWITAGGRVLSVCAAGATAREARERAYAAAARIRFEGMQRRADIAGPDPAETARRPRPLAREARS